MFGEEVAAGPGQGAAAGEDRADDSADLCPCHPVPSVPPFSQERLDQLEALLDRTEREGGRVER